MTATAERASWLEWRRGGIGASDVAAILGISPWDSPWSIWANKAGLFPDADESDEMEFGRWAELMIAPWFSERTGLVVAGEQMRLEHPEHPWRRCTVDGFVFDGAGAGWEATAIDRALGLMQIKTTGPGRSWDEIPAHIQAQEQWEMHVSGLERVWLPVLMGRRLDIHELARDQADIDYMVDRVERFWHDHVLTGTPPPTDGHDATLAALAAIYPSHTPKSSVPIDDVAGALPMLAEAKAAKKTAEEAERAATAVIRWAMKDAYEGTVASERAVTLGTQTRKVTCAKCEYVNESEPFRVLRPVKPKENA